MIRSGRQAAAGSLALSLIRCEHRLYLSLALSPASETVPVLLPLLLRFRDLCKSSVCLLREESDSFKVTQPDGEQIAVRT